MSIRTNLEPQQIWGTDYVVTNIVTPYSEKLPLETTTPDRSTPRYALEDLEETILKLPDSVKKMFQGLSSLLNKQLCHEELMAIKGTTDVLDELTKGNYTQEAILEYAQWTYEILYNHLSAQLVTTKTKCEQLL